MSGVDVEAVVAVLDAHGDYGQTAPRNVPARHRCGVCGQSEDAPIHADDHPFERNHPGTTNPRVDELRAIHQEATR